MLFNAKLFEGFPNIFYIINGVYLCVSGGVFSLVNGVPRLGDHLPVLANKHTANGNLAHRQSFVRLKGFILYLFYWRLREDTQKNVFLWCKRQKQKPFFSLRSKGGGTQTLEVWLPYLCSSSLTHPTVSALSQGRDREGTQTLETYTFWGQS